jgi:hypothetical protein
MSERRKLRMSVARLNTNILSFVGCENFCSDSLHVADFVWKLLHFRHFIRVPNTSQQIIYNNSVTWRPISIQCLKYAQATIEKVLQGLFSTWSAPCPLLGNGSLNTFPQKQTRGTIGNGAVNRLYQQCRLCFPWGPCKVDMKVDFRSW